MLDYLPVLVSVIVVNLLLSGDNALVIALASQRLPHRQQKEAIIWGGAGAVGMRLILIVLALYLLSIPYLQLIGGLLLLWISVKLVIDDHETSSKVYSAGSLWEAVKTILIADVVMSADNVIALAGVSQGNVIVLIIGLLLSIPVVIWGSNFITSIMQRWPFVIFLGAAFLGWTAGEMVIADSAARFYVENYPIFNWAIPSLFAAIVILTKLLQEKRRLGLRD
ncbi:MAG: integral rane protein TerC family protein [Firmicutes bacterium]|nr:integral rane protein TerC family protein [Bacillota bacterium]